MQSSAEAPVDGTGTAAGTARPPWTGRVLAAAERVPWRIVGSLVGLLLFGTALVVLQRLLGDVSYSDVGRAIGDVGWTQLGLSLLLTIFSYLALTGYDFFALRHIGRHEVPYRLAALASFTGYALSYTIGFQVFVAAAVRYRAYAVAGLSAAEVAALTLVSGLTFWLGIVFVLGLGLLIEAEQLTFLDQLGPNINRALGAALLAGIAVYLAWLYGKRRAVMAAGFRLPLPGFRSTFAQLGIGLADILGAAGALYVLLPAGTGIEFPTFAAIFIVAMALGMLSHAPGGAGVIEATLLVALPSVGADRLLAALLLWRLVYYLLPFGLALGLLASVEFARRRGLLARLGIVLAATLRPVAPVVLGVAVFVAGGTLLILNTLPSSETRLDLLQAFVPLAVVEAADLTASVVGMLLLLIARGLFRRLAVAYRAARILLPLGIAAALLKGLDWESALPLLFVFVLLVVNRRAFYRRERLWRDPVPSPWFAAVLTVFAGSIWIGFFAYAHVEQPGSLWTEFAWNGEAPRFLRASLAAGTAALLLGLMRLRWPGDAGAPMLREREIAALVARDGGAEAARALLPHRRFLIADARDACIVYGVRGRSFVALGDPIGAPDRDAELVWAFRDLAERHGGWPVVYEASEERLPLYTELGLSAVKIAEEARIDLPDFAPALAAELAEAPQRARIETAIIRAADLPPMLPRLAEVFDAWAAAERRDKSLLVPEFDGDYIARFDAVIARQRGRLVAFGSLVAGSRSEDMAMFPVHVRPEGRKAVMRALLLGGIEHARRRGCRWFDLGTAPLPAVPADSPLPSLSPSRVRAFRYGGFFEEAEDLRRFKQRFRPVWRPRYLVCPGGIALPQILHEAALLAEGRSAERKRRAPRLLRFGLTSRRRSSEN